MGKRGPMPKKKILKVLSGKLPLKKEYGTDFVVEFNPPLPPDSLTTDERNIWNKTLELLKPLRVIEEIDAAVLAAYVCSYVRWQDAEREIQKASKQGKKYGLVSIGAAGGLVTNPIILISRRCQSDMVTYAAQLGMTPAARLRIQVVKDNQPSNPFQRLKDEKLGTAGQGLCEIGFDKK